MIKAVIFDMDNTLFDLRTASEAAADVVSYLTDGEYILHFLPLNSHNDRRVRKSIAEYLGLDVTDSRIEHPVWLYKTLEQSCFAEFSGMRDVLSALKAAGLRLAVLSNTDGDGVRKRLDALGYTEYFDAVLCREDTEELKPSPAAFQAVLRVLGVSADEAVMIGDRLDNDIYGARACGMQAIHAWYGSIAEKDESMCAETPEDILRILHGELTHSATRQS